MTDYSPILNERPFSISQQEKDRIFLQEMRTVLRWHYENCQEFRKICDNRNFNLQCSFKAEDIPFLPVSIFKKFDLLSVRGDQIIKTLFSSSTSGYPSKIMIDKITSHNQVLALSKIMTDFLGNKKMHFIIFDAEAVIKSNDGELSSRGTAIRGMLPFAKKLSFVLNDNLTLDLGKLGAAFGESGPEDKICFFGFSWLFYNIYLENRGNNKLADFFVKSSNKDSVILHIGGWKKLKDMNVSKQEFNKNLSHMFLTDENKIIDIYGMTEQLGTIYPDCEYGFKHAPLYSEVIIRDINSLQPLGIGHAGFIQLLSPLPHSYPGVSLLSDDLGKLVGIDDCKCQRKGKYFVFEKRSESAEPKGCGDLINI